MRSCRSRIGPAPALPADQQRDQGEDGDDESQNQQDRASEDEVHAALSMLFHPRSGTR